MPIIKSHPTTIAVAAKREIVRAKIGDSVTVANTGGVPASIRVVKLPSRRGARAILEVTCAADAIVTMTSCPPTPPETQVGLDASAVPDTFRI